MSKTLYLIDGHAQIYRCYYAPFPPLSSPGGEPTKATHVFTQMLLSLLRNRRPDYLAMVMDVSDSTVFRRQIDPAYKSTRPPPPDDLLPQIERISSILEAMKVPIFRRETFEADDLMATIVERLGGEDVEVYLVSNDKDLDQLLGDRVSQYDPGKDQVLTADTLPARRGYTPAQAVEVQTLAGDTVDNVRGIEGVGVKTAAKLIAKYGSAEAAVAHADELTPKLRERVRAFADRLPQTKQIVTLRRDAPIEFDLNRCRVGGFDLGAARPIFAELGFSRLLEQIEGGEAATATAAGAGPAAQAEARYELVNTDKAFESFLKKLRAKPTFAFDTETTHINPVDARLVGLSFCWRAGEAYYVPVRAPMGAALPESRVLDGLRPILADAEVAKCGQNIKYDLIVLKRHGVPVGGVSFDTMIASFVLDSTRRSHGLDHLAAELLGHRMTPLTDLIGKGRDQLTMDQVDVHQVCAYAAEDADYTWRLKELFEPQIRRGGFEKLFYETEMPLVEVLADMENNGVALDTELLARMSNTLADRMLDLTKRIHREVGHSFNIDSPKQLAGVLFDELGLPVIRRTKTARSTDAGTLEELASRTGHPLPKLVLEYRELSKLKGTYIDALPEMISPATGRIHASFNQTGAVTGRLSSSDPNLQNIPVRTETGRQIRRAFVAGEPDHLIVTADYSQIELRILAHLSGDVGMTQAFADDLDIHRVVAAEVFSLPLDQVDAESRGRAKAVNFGIVYGQTPYGLSRQTGMSVEDARTFIDAYFRRYPGVRAFLDRSIAEAKAAGYVTTMLGRRRMVPEINSRNRQQAALGERYAVNTIVQGSAADLIKTAMVRLHARIRRENRRARMLIQVHDELVFEVPASELEADVQVIREEMAGALPLRVPLKVDIAWGRNWLEGK